MWANMPRAALGMRHLIPWLLLSNRSADHGSGPDSSDILGRALQQRGLELDWHIEPHRLKLMQRPGGEYWRLGQGSFGTVRAIITLSCWRQCPNFQANISYTHLHLASADGRSTDNMTSSSSSGGLFRPGAVTSGQVCWGSLQRAFFSLLRLAQSKPAHSMPCWPGIPGSARWCERCCSQSHADRGCRSCRQRR